MSFLLVEIGSDEYDECSASIVNLRETVRSLAEELLDSLGEPHEPIDPNLVRPMDLTADRLFRVYFKIEIRGRMLQKIGMVKISDTYRSWIKHHFADRR